MDNDRVLRILSALLPDSDVQVVVMGENLAVTVCRDHDCETFVVPPTITSAELVARFGGEPAATQPESSSPSVVVIRSVEDLTGWMKTAPRGARARYFVGNLAQFRHEAPGQVIRLQSEAEKMAGTRQSVRESRILNIQETQQVLTAIDHLLGAEAIRLVQARLTDGAGTAYYIVKA